MFIRKTFTAVFSLIILLAAALSACSCKSDTPKEKDTAISSVEPTVSPGQRNRVNIVIQDRMTGDVCEPEVYFHCFYASRENGTVHTEIDGTSFFDMIPNIKEELTQISDSGYIIFVEEPDPYYGYNKEAVVYLTSEPCTVMVNFKTFEEALSYAEAHLDGEPVIDIVTRYFNRDKGDMGTEKGEEGCAFMLVP